jgi:GntR family transcriptional regulator
VEVDRSSAVAPYVQVAGQLRDMITRGVLAPGSRLPSADSIAQEAGIARMTARKALRLLRDQGWAFASIGMGTYVAPRDQWPQGDAPR